ncbi:MAG: diacylglycerol/lipid kinase family protein [Saprospiraceae bacterium]
MTHLNPEHPDMSQRSQPTLLIFNPRAGMRQLHKTRDLVEKHIDQNRFRCDFAETLSHGHALKLGREAAQSGYTYVIAVGGDGSVNEIATALIGTDTVLGVLPAGSGNGLARGLGMGGDLKQAVGRLNTAQATWMDYGLLNGRPFFNVVGIGYDGLMSHLIAGSRFRGLWGYLYLGLGASASYRFRDYTATDGERVAWHGEALLVAAANGSVYGYGLQITPQAQPDDGALELVVVSRVPKWRYIVDLPKVLRGRMTELDYVHYFPPQKDLCVRCNIPSHAHVDGEAAGICTDYRIEIRTRGLRVLRPAIAQASK